MSSPDDFDHDLASLGRRVAQDALGAAILAAFEEAGRRRSETWADAVSRPLVEDPADAEDPMGALGTPAASGASDPTDPGAVEFGRGLHHVLQDVAAGLDGLADDLAAVHLSYIGDKVGLVDMYRNLQDRLIRLLNEGTETFESLAAALRSAADGYERDEAEAVHRLNNIY